MRRRTLLAGVGAAGLASLSGCLGVIGMDEHESSPAGVEAAAREGTGYDQTGIDEVVVERDVGIGPLSSTISVTNYVTEHDKAVEMPGPLGRQRGAVFVVLSTPKVGLLGRNFNPVEEMDAAELIELVEENYDDIGNVEPEEDESIEILGESTTKTRFSAQAQFDGRDVDVYVHVSEAVETADDLLVTLGVYPQLLQSSEEANVRELMASVIEEANPDDSVDPDESNGDGIDGVTDADDALPDDALSEDEE